MAKLIYDKGFENDSIIGSHDAHIKNLIKSQLNKHDAFINTTWLEIDKDLIKILKENPNRIICYSGPDWENTVCRKKCYDFIDKHKNVIQIGNSYGKHYFSFWLDFVFNHQQRYQSFDVWDLQKLKPYMCLNRKPHIHRIELVKEIYDKNLQNNGHLSLGVFPNNDITWDYKGLEVPIKLKKDIKNIKGDYAVAGTAGGITNDITGLGHPDNWNSHFLNIVTETTIHTNVFLSEKIFKPILGMRPFIVLGDDKVYEVLKNWGFDTFDDIVGTGYIGKYYTDRIEWIVEVINNISKDQHLKELLIKLKPRLEDNKKLFKDIALKNRHKIHNLEL